MRHTQLTLEQSVTNKVNGLQDFTTKISGSHRAGRYVVATKNIWKGEHTNKVHNMLEVITDGIEEARSRGCDSIGGWRDSEDGVYYVDMCVHFTRKKTAMEVAIANKEIAVYDLAEEKEINVEQYIKEYLL